MDDVWARDLSVLRVAVEWFDDLSLEHRRLSVAQIAQQTGLSEDEVTRAVRNLATVADPPYLVGLTGLGSPIPVVLHGVTERALRDSGSWPTAESMADRIVTAFNRAADEESDAERRGWLRKAAAWFGGAGRDVLVDVTAAVVRQHTGLG